MTFRAKKKPEPLAEAALYDYALNALGRRMRTVAELTRLMRQRVEPGETGQATINSVIARLKEYGFLNDSDYAATTPACGRRTRASANAESGRTWP